MHSTYPEVRALPSKNKTANPPMYVVFPFCWRFFPPHGCIFVYRLGFYCFYFLITRSIFLTKNLSVANAGNSIYPIFSSRGKGISGPSVCQRSATLRTKLGNPDINLAVLSQILPDKSLLQSATMSVYYFDGLQPVENPQCFLVLAWFGLWPAAGDLTPATLQNPEVARHT